MNNNTDKKYAIAWNGPLKTHISIIDRGRVNYLIRAATSRRENNITETISGYRINDCGLIIDLIQ